MNDILKSVIGSAIVLILFGIFTFIRDRYSLRIARSDPHRPSHILNALLITGWVCNIAFIFIVFLVNPAIWWWIPIFSVWCLAVAIYLWRQRTRLRGVGVVGADLEIRKGINYKRSLSLCHNTLRFLGIGAAKLTKEDEFEKAIRRCRPEQPIKFLLCEPTHDILIEAAKRFGKDRDEYKDIVTNSLRKIAQLKERYSNIEVRFYSTFQIFRLMFIDDSICLVSYNVMGQGDGSQLPQLHILRAPQSQQDVNSFYYTLERYFDILWDLAKPWNFKDYLE